jgi:KipI family sensor histidine kinase inhibitor
VKAYAIGDSCLCWPLGKTINAATSARALRLYRALKRLQSEGRLAVTDIVPSYNSVAVYFDPVAADVSRIRVVVQACLSRPCRGPTVAAPVGRGSPRALSTNSPRPAGAATEKAKDRGDEGDGKTVILPVQYDGEDLERVATHTGLSRQQVIRLHAGGKYVVAMIGFLPHFPYLIGLPTRLATPRLSTPRLRVPAGAVAIGGAQTGVYPRESPGGWNLIGRTDPALLIPLAPGDRVVFKPS